MVMAEMISSSAITTVRISSTVTLTEGISPGSRILGETSKANRLRKHG